MTRFLALDKVQKPKNNRYNRYNSGNSGSSGNSSGSSGGDNRDSYIQFIDIPIDKFSNPNTTSTNTTTNNNRPVILSYDLEWLAILKKTHHLLESALQAQSQSYVKKVYMPTSCDRVTDDDIQYIQDRFDQVRGGDVSIPYIPHTPNDPQSRSNSHEVGNVQTDRLLELLELPHIWTQPHGHAQGSGMGQGMGQGRVVGGGQSQSHYQPQAQSHYQPQAQSQSHYQPQPKPQFHPPPPPGPPPSNPQPPPMAPLASLGLLGPNPDTIPIPMSMLDENEISIDDI